MSSGAAEILGQALKVPVLREIVLVLATFWGGSIALAEGNWSLFLLIVACATGVSAVYLAKFLGRRARRGSALWLVVALIVLLSPILVVAWLSRRGRNG